MFFSRGWWDENVLNGVEILDFSIWVPPPAPLLPNMVYLYHICFFSKTCVQMCNCLGLLNFLFLTTFPHVDSFLITSLIAVHVSLGIFTTHLSSYMRDPLATSFGICVQPASSTASPPSTSLTLNSVSILSDATQHTSIVHSMHAVLNYCVMVASPGLIFFHQCFTCPARVCADMMVNWWW